MRRGCVCVSVVLYDYACSTCLVDSQAVKAATLAWNWKVGGCLMAFQRMQQRKNSADQEMTSFVSSSCAASQACSIGVVYSDSAVSSARRQSWGYCCFGKVDESKSLCLLFFRRWEQVESYIALLRILLENEMSGRIVSRHKIPVGVDLRKRLFRGCHEMLQSWK